MHRSLSDWVDYIQTLHPRTIDMGLERVSAVWARMGRCELPPVIAVAGTNGKGSSVSMLESVYRHAGYSTGSFSSPHLQRFNERICLNNAPVDDAKLLSAFEQIEALRGDISLTFFEYNVLLALQVFCAEKLDIVLLEVGMGGRLDAVNMIDNQLALITAIDLDHCAWLGDTRELIGAEKAGIIKSEGRAVIADFAAPESLINRARHQGADFVTAGLDYQLQSDSSQATRFYSEHSALLRYSGLELPSAPLHQHHNMAGVIAAVALMRSYIKINPEQLRSGLARQFLRGRLQYIKGSPDMLLDVSHNDQSLRALHTYIENLNVRGRVHAVFGALADKHYAQAFEGIKDIVSDWYLCSLDGERGQTALEIKRAVFGEEVENSEISAPALFDKPGSALIAAKQAAAANDLIVIFGSFHVVGAIIGDLDI